MGRPARFRIPGIPQLISQRGHNRLPCFLDGSDYAAFREALSASAESAGSTIHAVLMLPQAYWVLASPREADSIARMIQRTGRCYVRHCNRKYRREGTLWAGRYQACLVEPGAGSLRRCAEFLAATPQRTGMVTAEVRWPWFFLEDSLEDALGSGPGSDEDYEEIATVLKMGLVLGSEKFRSDLASKEGIRTEPGVRGRPRADAQ